jgi:hypothetical protein
MNRKYTRHDGGSIRKFRKGGEVNSPLPDLHHWPLALVLVILIRTLPLIRLPRPQKIFDKVVRTTAIETFSVEIVERLAVGQTVAAVAEALEVCIL